MELRELTDEALERVFCERFQHLKEQEDPAVIQRLYQETIFPIEVERIRRDAASEGRLDLLFVTVGAQPDSPYLAVLASPADYVVLLHTDRTEGHAREVIQRLALTADRGTLQTLGDGNNPVILYKAAFELWQSRGQPEKVGFDLTGGLKTMSAAAAAAGFALPGARVFYIDSEQQRLSGVPLWVKERRIEVANPYEVFGEIRRATARTLLQDGRYAAAAELYRQLEQDVGQPGDKFRARLAAGYAAIEGLDFKQGAQKLEELADELDRSARFLLSSEEDELIQQRAWIRANAQGAGRLAALVELGPRDADPTRDVEILREETFLEFITMLLCSARRRERERQLDVAALLAYRALEAIPQRRLAVRGLDPSALDWGALASTSGQELRALVERYNQCSGERGRLDIEALPERISRTASFALLACAFPDDLAAVSEIKKFSGIGESRNRSLLAHGVKQLSLDVVERLIAYAEELFERLLAVEGVSGPKRDALWGRHRFLEIAS